MIIIVGFADYNRDNTGQILHIYFKKNSKYPRKVNFNLFVGLL